MKNNTLYFVGLIMVLANSVQAQDTLVTKHFSTFNFIDEKSNRIQNVETLTPFYEDLYHLKSENKSQVILLHIGDSHIQADIISGTTRALLQEQFGNAGLGLSFPGRAARTNESPLIYSSAKGEWEINKISYSQNETTIGIAGVSLSTKTVGSKIIIKSISPSYSFNRMTLFFDKVMNSFNLNVIDSSGQFLALVGAFTEESYPDVSKIRLPYSVNEIQLESTRTLSSQNQLTLYGISLENDRPGIRYHTLGVNGARYISYLKSNELLKQTAALNANLIIISLGTNEAADHPDVDRKISSKINALVEELKTLNPNSIILLTTPIDFYKKRTRRNPGVSFVKNKIIESAHANQLPYWNLYEVAGGNHAADRWKKADLLQPDGIHFTAKGYELQGQLLFDAIIKGYNEYVFHQYSKTH